jgi:HK97 family phage portal protein
MRFPRLFGRQEPAPPIEEKASATSGFMVMTPGQPQWRPRNYEEFARQGYAWNVVCYQSVNRIADAVASVRWGVFRGDDEIAEHPLITLLARPNPMQAGSEYIRAKVANLLIAGNSYEERVTVGREVRELYQQRPDRMTVIADKGGITAYEFTGANQQRFRWPVDPLTLDSDIRHLKLYNPLSPFYGMAPIEAAHYAINQHNEAMCWLQALLQNSARPSGALVVGDRSLADDEFARLKAQIEEQYSGGRNAGRPMLLEGGLDWKSMGLSPVDMAVVETKNSAARDIALAFGVPPQLLGIPGDNTYSNYEQARLAFFEDTVIPLVDMIAQDWTDWLGEAYGVRIVPDLDQIPAIADKRKTLWDMADKATDLTINERREMKGYDTIPGGDVVLVGSGMIPLGMAVEPLAPMDLISPDDARRMAYGDDTPAG